MKPFLTVLLAITLMSCGGGTTTPTPTPAAPLEVAKTAVGTLIGSPVTQAIGASGGNATVVSAGAKIIVPAGALADGSSITVQAISNTLVGAGQGVRLSGSDWTQPITLQFSYPASIGDPENQMIAVQNPDGSWVSSNRVKVDAVNRTISIRLAPDPSSLLTKTGLKTTGLKPAATTNSRDIIWTQKFFLKPNTTSVKLGESVSFTAYAKQARNRGEAKLSPDELDLLDRYYVLKSQFENLLFEVDDDFLVPMSTVVKEYPFTNTKTGYNRVWTTSGPGSIVPSGATSGKFTAPTDPSAKGKTATVTFISTNTKTGDIARASASVNIEGDGATYKGTVTVKQFHDITTGPANGQTIRKYSATITGNMVWEIESNNATRPIFKGNPAKSSTICDGYAYSTDTYFGAERHTKGELVSADGSDGILDPGLVRIYMDKTKNTYELSGELSTKTTVKDTDYDGSFITYPFLLRIGFGVRDLPLGDGIQLSGSNTYQYTDHMYTVTWNLTRQ
jgi:hypothetical protein